MIIVNMAAGSGEPGPPPCKVGDIVSCLTCLDARIEGEVLAYDATSRLLALKKAASSGDRKNLCDISIVNLGLVGDFKVTVAAKEPPREPPSLDINKLTKRSEDNIHEKKMRIKLASDGISMEGIQLYHTIQKTLKCRWMGDKMIINDDVTIDPPYTADCCTGTEAAVKHVRLVIEKHYREKKATL
ncbi:protein LSM12 homolog B-like [Diadema antillarum]|uniref:protein LSM12 homolog B-like n=1 Tax=Diadema antillarum TaxID=105358 RepID=UPI003A87A8FF